MKLRCLKHGERVMVLERTVVHRSAGKNDPPCDTRKVKIGDDRFTVEEVREWTDI